MKDIKDALRRLMNKKVKIIPAANETDFSEIERKIRLIEELKDEFVLNEMHIDISDGSFTPTNFWHEPKDLERFDTPLGLELHLMLADIDGKIDNWLMTPAKRLIFHIETSQNSEETTKKIKKAGKEAGIAVNPETPPEALKPFLGLADMFLILGVNPGASGQKMLSGTPERISELRKICGNCIIEADGGVTLQNTSELARAGANRIVAASAIFKSENPKEAVKKLMSEI